MTAKSTIDFGFRENNNNLSIDVSEILNPEQLENIGNKLKTEAEERRDYLFRNTKLISGILGTDHPLEPLRINESTKVGLDSMVARMRLGDIQTVSVDKMKFEDAPGNLAVFGGPLSTLQSRLLFGLGGKSPLLGINLPITFRKSNEILNPLDLRGRWDMIVEDQSLPDGKEFLTITSLPLDQNTKLIFVAGLTGTGTKAFDHLMLSPRTLHRINRESKDFDAWQSIIEVSFDAKRLPTGIGDFRIIPIQYDFGKMHRPLRDRLFLSDQEVQDLRDLLPSAPVLAKSKLYDKIPLATYLDIQKPDAGDLRRTPTKSQFGWSVRQSWGDLADGPSEGKEFTMGNPIEDEAKTARKIVKISVLSEDEQRPLRGKPKKGSSVPLATRRLNLLVSGQEFERIERLMKLTDARSITDTIRDALRVYEKVIDKVAAR